MFVKHTNKTRTSRSNTTQSSYNTLIQRADTARKCQEDAHIKQDQFCFQFLKSGKEKIKKTISYNTENTTRIQQVYTTRIQHEMYTTRIIQYKVVVLGAGL